MDKKKYRPIPRSKKERTGLNTGLLDMNGREIKTGDFVSLTYRDYSGPVLWSRYNECFGIFSGLWYGDLNPYNPDCYGKFIMIPKDNGMRMHIKLCEEYPS